MRTRSGRCRRGFCGAVARAARREAARAGKNTPPLSRRPVTYSPRAQEAPHMRTRSGRCRRGFCGAVARAARREAARAGKNTPPLSRRPVTYSPRALQSSWHPVAELEALSGGHCMLHQLVWDIGNRSGNGSFAGVGGNRLTLRQIAHLPGPSLHIALNRAGSLNGVSCHRFAAPLNLGSGPGAGKPLPAGPGNGAGQPRRGESGPPMGLRPSISREWFSLPLGNRTP